MNFLKYLEEERKRNNRHLIKAKTTKDDEFYTSYDNAKLMITPFTKYLVNKIILCNCDDPDKSEVFNFLKDNFDNFKIKRLIGIGYGTNMRIITTNDIQDIEVKNNGDFRTGESLETLKTCDIVISNPPFSDNMFIDFIKLVMQNNKDLLAIGPLDGAKAKDITQYIIDSKLFVIRSPYQDFKRPDNAKSFANMTKVAVYTTFKDDPFGIDITLNNDIDIDTLPIDDYYMVPISISHDGKFSIMEIPANPSDNINKIIVPLHILRKKWRNHFKIINIINTVKCNNKKLMSGILMEYI